MRKGAVVALVCAALAAGASSVGAQSSTSHITSADKASPSVRLHSALSASRALVRHLRSRERQAVKDAQRVADLGTKPASQATVEKYAMLSQKHLQEVLDLLNVSATHSKPNPHLEDVRLKQNQAIGAVHILVTESRRSRPNADAVIARANDVATSAQAALALLTTPRTSDNWIIP